MTTIMELNLCKHIGIVAVSLHYIDCFPWHCSCQFKCLWYFWTCCII